MGRDWLDVMDDLGAELVVAGLARGEVITAEGRGDRGDWSGQGGVASSSTRRSSADLGGEDLDDLRDDKGEHARIMPPSDLMRARLFMSDRLAVGPDGVRRFIAVRGLTSGRNETAGLWRFDGSAYIVLHDDALRAMVRRWLDDEPLYRKTIKPKGQIKWSRAIISPGGINAIVEAVRDDLTAEPGEGRTAFWRALDAIPSGPRAGEPIYHEDAWHAVLSDQEARDAGLPVIEDLLILPSLCVDLAAWDKGDLVTTPRSSRLFSDNVLPHDLGLDELRALSQAWEAGGALDPDRPRYERVIEAIEVIAEHCEVFADFLASAFDATADPTRYTEQVAELLKALGYWIGRERHREFGNLCVFYGPSGAGKGTMVQVVRGLLGASAAPMSIGQLTDETFIVRLRGKSLAIDEEAKVGRMTDGDRALAEILAMTGGAPRTTRAMYRDASEAVPIAGRILLACRVLPSFKGAGDLKRRMLVINFPPRTGAADEGLKQRLATPGALKAALVGALIGRRWLAREGFVQPESSAFVMQTYLDEVELIPAEFVDEWIEIHRPGVLTGPDGQDPWTPTAEISAALRCYLQGESRIHTAWSESKLLQQLMPVLQSAGWRGTRTQRTVRDEVGEKKRPRGWTLVTLTEVARDAMEEVRRGGAYGGGRQGELGGACEPPVG